MDYCQSVLIKGATHDFSANTSFYLLHPAREAAENSIISTHAWEREINLSHSNHESNSTYVLQTEVSGLGLTPANFLQHLIALLPSLEYKVHTFVHAY